MKFTLSVSNNFSFEKKFSLKQVSKLGFIVECDYEGGYTLIPEWDDSYRIPEIEINSLEELIEFQKEFGQIIISDSHSLTNNKGIKNIEIYNGYRE